MHGFPAKFAKGILATADGRGGWEPVSALRLLTDADTAAAGTLFYGQGTKILATLAPATGLLMRNGAGAPTTTLAPSLDSITATGSGGLLLKNSSGTTVATIGAGPGTGVTLAGALAVAGAVTGVTTLAASGQVTSTVSTGTAPLVIASTTRVANLNVANAGAADTVTTNANLTGPITSVGNATSVAAQTGTGTTFVMNTSPTLVTPALGVASATSVAASGAITSATNVIGTDPGGSELLRVGGSILAGGILNVSHSTSGDNAAYLRNTHASGYGPVIRGGGASAELYHLLIQAYDGTERMTLKGDGALLLGTDPGGSELLRVGGAGRIGGNLFLSGILNMATYTPASASDNGTAGYICWDSSYIYVCTGVNTWKRAAIATW